MRILSTIDRELLKPSASVALHKHSNALVDVLPPEADSSITMLSNGLFYFELSSDDHSPNCFQANEKYKLLGFFVYESTAHLFLMRLFNYNLRKISLRIMHMYVTITIFNRIRIFILQSFYLSSQSALTVYLQVINGH